MRILSDKELKESCERIILKNILAAIVMLLICFIVYIELRANVPDKYAVSLQEFNGRVFNEETVKPEAFTINESFKEALLWGEEAIMSVGDEKIIIWKPDKKTAGLFQYAEKSLSGFWYDSSIQRMGTLITIKPKIKWEKGGINGVISISGLIWVIYGLIIPYCIRIKPSELRSTR